MKFLQGLAIGLMLVSFVAPSVQAKDYLVKNQKEYKQALKRLESGDKIVLANGVWNDFEILFKGRGTKSKPIELTAQTKGKVILSGQSNLRLAGEHLIVSGLVFKDGFTPTSEVISFRQNKNNLANYSRVTEIVIDNFNNPEKYSSDKWVVLYGKHNRFDHSALVGKRTSGVTMAVRLNTEASQQNHHKIDHNYFGPRPILGSNGGETLRIGTSHYSLTDSFTTVENNYFDRCNGEVEIISNKSGKNVIRNNTFFESRGTLTLRHGNGNIVENNVFFGNGVDHTGGIRVINGDQTIRNNYMEGLTGYRFGSGFTIMNGVPNSPINRYHQVDNANIHNNTLVNVDHIHFGAGADKERSAAPVNSQFKNNLISHNAGIDGITLFDDISGITFSNNALNEVAKPTISSGFQSQRFELKRHENGLLYPTKAELKKRGVSASLAPTAKAQVGPIWYVKSEPTVAFDSGKVWTIKPTEDSILKAIEQASSGDIIELTEGHYIVRKMVSLHKVLTFKGVASKVSLAFERKTLFSIEDGGSLKLQNLTITGEDAPDSAGNTLIRNSRLPTIINYRLLLDGVTIKDLDKNHSFHVFDSGYRAFADAIRIENSHFENITGDVLRLDKERDDLGIYNAEYITIKNSKFIDVQGSLANVYRGGTDESTFGPHVEISNNEIENVGNGKRNKSKALMTLHGAQVTEIQSNEIKNSPYIVLNHTVGEPISEVSNNRFRSSSKPEVTELNSGLAPTAILSGNEYTPN